MSDDTNLVKALEEIRELAGAAYAGNAGRIMSAIEQRSVRALFEASRAQEQLAEAVSNIFPRAVAMPRELHPATKKLVLDFASAMADKLMGAQEKYGFNNEWTDSVWQDECRAHLYEHLAKGDPRDVANYCAFMWHHGWSTSKQPGDQP